MLLNPKMDGDGISSGTREVEGSRTDSGVFQHGAADKIGLSVKSRQSTGDSLPQSLVVLAGCRRAPPTHCFNRKLAGVSTIPPSMSGGQTRPRSRLLANKQGRSHPDAAPSGSCRSRYEQDDMPAVGPDREQRAGQHRQLIEPKPHAYQLLAKETFVPGASQITRRPGMRSTRPSAFSLTPLSTERRSPLGR